MTAPLLGALNVRTSEQLKEDLADMQLFEAWLAGLSTGIVMRHFDFTYAAGNVSECRKTPLSWKLTRPQSECIDKVWNAGAAKQPYAAEIENLKSFLAGDTSKGRTALQISPDQR